MKNQNRNVPRGTMATKPDCGNLTGSSFDLAQLRGFRLFAVVFDTAHGADVYGVFSNPREARSAKREFRKASKEICGDCLPAIVVPLEIPRHYFS